MASCGLCLDAFGTNDAIYRRDGEDLCMSCENDRIAAERRDDRRTTMAKSFCVQEILSSGKLVRERSIQADDPTEAAQLYLRSVSRHDVTYVGEYRARGALMLGEMRAIGGYEYRVDDRHVRVTR